MNKHCGYGYLFGLKGLSAINKLLSIAAIFIFISINFSTFPLFAQNNLKIINADSLAHRPDGLKLQNAAWQFHPGDRLEWKDTSFKTQNWAITPTNFGNFQPLKNWRGIGWFRLWVEVSPSLQNKMLALRINHDGASEIYLDGQKIAGFGKVGHSAQQMRSARAPYQIIPVLLRDTFPHLLAVRYSNFHAYFPDFIGFQVWVDRYQQMAMATLNKIQANDFSLISAGAQIALVLLHFFLFVFYPGQKVNLYYSFFVLMSATSIYLKYIFAGTTNPAL